MQVKQIYSLINSIQMEIMGDAYNDPDNAQYIIQEDLSNIVTVGTKLLDSTSQTTAGTYWRDNYVKALIDRIGRMVFVERAYRSIFPDLRRDEWEYGSILTKSRCKRFSAKTNPSWSLTAGQTVEQFAFEPPTVMSLFFNDKIAWQVDCSFADVQLRESFTSPREMDRFLSMIEANIGRSLDAQIDSIQSRVLDCLMAEHLYVGKGVIDVLAGYNATVSTPITAADARFDPDFLRYFAYQVLLTKQRMGVMSGWYQIADSSGYETQTPPDRLRFALHSDIAQALDVYLQSTTYHDELTSIGSYTAVPMWQTSGSESGAFDFNYTSRIDAKLASDNTHTVNRTHIIGVMWDWDAAVICNQNRRVTSAYNANGEYWTNFYKIDTMSLIDLMENCVVFVLGTGTVPTITITGDDTVAAESTLSLTATATGAGQSPTITWTSSDTSVATVNAGTVTGVKAGDAVISASVTVDGTTYTDTHDVEVTAKT